MPSNHLILCQPLLVPPSIFPSMRVFSNESVLCIRWPKHWSFSFSISPSNEYSGLISFRIDWLDLLEVQGPLKSLLQHHSSKASILRHYGLQFNSVTQSCLTLCNHVTTACQASLSTTNSRSLLKFTSIELVVPSNRLILCRPLLLPPSVFSSIRVFSNESVLCITWPKYWSFSFSISPSMNIQD